MPAAVRLTKGVVEMGIKTETRVAVKGRGGDERAGAMSRGL